VPFLEQASLESPESSLIDMWASLLASAAQNFRSYHTHFVSIISQLSAKQGLILKSIIGTESAYGLELGMDNMGVYGLFQSYRIRKEIEQVASKLTERTNDAVFR
jgi:Abortive infection alpha